MAKLDLSNALALRVGNTDALALRIANVDVWTAQEAPSYVEHSVFNPNQPYPLPVTTDAWPPTLTTYAEAFYTYGDVPEGAEVIGARLWIPAGVTAETVDIHLYWTDAVIATPQFDARHTDGAAALWMSAPTETITVPITGTEQWVEARFQTPRPLTKDAPVHIGQTFPDSAAVWADGQTTDYIPAYDGFPVVLSEAALGYVQVRNRRYIEGESIASSWYGRVHGHDIIVRVPAEPTE